MKELNNMCKRKTRPSRGGKIVQQFLDFNLDVLRYFVKIADLKNFTQASKVLYISQSTLSRHIKELEEKLNKTLFIRKKYGVELSPDGEAFYQKCKHLLDTYDSFVSEVAMPEGPQTLSGSISVMYQRPVRHLMRELNARFSDEYPNISLQCDLLNYTNPVDSLLSRAADCVYMYQSEYQRIHRRNLVAFPVCEFGWVAVMRSSNPLAKNESVRLTDLADQKFISVEQQVSPANFEEVFSACNQAGFDPNIVKYTVDVENMINYAFQYDGVTIIPDNTYTFRKDGLTVSRPIIDYPYPYVSYLVALSENRTPLVDCYLSRVRDYLESGMPDERDNSD